MPFNQHEKIFISFHTISIPATGEG